MCLAIFARALFIKTSNQIGMPLFAFADSYMNHMIIHMQRRLKHNYHT